MSKARSPREVSSITMGMRGLMAASMLAQDRQHIGSIGEGQVAVRASVVCLVRARELRYEDVREAAGGGVEDPRNGREVTEPGASRDYLAGRPSKSLRQVP
jgi:hypothetical protein